MKTYTLCGSSRFSDAHQIVMMHEALMGNIVIPMSLYGHSDEPQGAEFLTSDGDETTPEKQGLDELHFQKIKMSDGIIVVNVGGYVGNSTKREIRYALQRGKDVVFLFPDAVDAALEQEMAEAEHEREAFKAIERLQHPPYKVHFHSGGLVKSPDLNEDLLRSAA